MAALAVHMALFPVKIASISYHSPMVADILKYYHHYCKITVFVRIVTRNAARSCDCRICLHPSCHLAGQPSHNSVPLSQS